MNAHKDTWKNLQTKEFVPKLILTMLSKYDDHWVGRKGELENTYACDFFAIIDRLDNTLPIGIISVPYIGGVSVCELFKWIASNTSVNPKDRWPNAFRDEDLNTRYRISISNTPMANPNWGRYKDTLLEHYSNGLKRTRGVQEDFPGLTPKQFLQRVVGPAMRRAGERGLTRVDLLETVRNQMTQEQRRRLVDILKEVGFSVEDADQSLIINLSGELALR